MAKFQPTVTIIEAYKDYNAPIDATATTQTLIDNIPQKFLAGLGHIVITNRSGLTRRELRKKIKSRKRKIRMDAVRGVYHGRTSKKPAWIEIYIDQIHVLDLKFCQMIPFFREHSFSEVLYHEIGHHIHTVIHPEYKDPEDVAEKWEAILWRYYIRKKYRYLVPFFRLLYKVSETATFQRFQTKMLADVVESQREK